jgi:hypothetical protein
MESTQPFESRRGEEPRFVDGALSRGSPPFDLREHFVEIALRNV